MKKRHNLKLTQLKMEKINGKYYPLWSQFIEKKKFFIGGELKDYGDDFDRAIYKLAEEADITTTILDIRLKPNGDSSAFFEIIGKDFSCGFDVRHGGIIPGKEGWTTFGGFGGQKFAIKEYKPPFTVGQFVHYTNSAGRIDNGRVKTLHPDRKDAVWVVYNCGENWDMWMNYTGVLSDISNLSPGWKEKEYPNTVKL